MSALDSGQLCRYASDALRLRLLSEHGPAVAQVCALVLLGAPQRRARRACEAPARPAPGYIADWPDR